MNTWRDRFAGTPRLLQRLALGHVASRTDLGDIDYGGFVINAVINAKAPNAAAPIPGAAAKVDECHLDRDSAPSRPEQRRADASCLRRLVPDIVAPGEINIS